jgi:hypothetical protein
MCHVCVGVCDGDRGAVNNCRTQSWEPFLFVLIVFNTHGTFIFSKAYVRWVNVTRCS